MSEALTPDEALAMTREYGLPHPRLLRTGRKAMDSNVVDLGDDHTLVFSEYQGEANVGATIAHKKPDGTECGGWIAIEGRSWAKSFDPGSIATWTITQESPLTLTPSILCRACGDHGFVTNGRWVRA